MYTFIETANMLGITRQTLYNKEKELKSKGFIQIKNNTRFITTEGINYLREEYLPNMQQSKRHIKKEARQSTKSNEQIDNLIKSLMQEQKEIYQEQISYLKAQIERLELNNKELLEMIKSKDILISQISNSMLPASKKTFSFFKKKNVN